MQTSSPTWVFQKLRIRRLHNTLRLMFGQSVARLATIIVSSVIIWTAMFFVARFGLHQITSPPWDFPLDRNFGDLLLDLLFLSLTLLLVFSTSIILYNSLFSSEESRFLLSTPLADDHLFAYKFHGAVGFSSWAFVLLGSPILIAYGIGMRGGAPWSFYVMLPLFFLGFLLMPGSIGGMATLIVVNLMPKRRAHILAFLLIAVFGTILVWLYHALSTVVQAPFATRGWFNNLIGEIDLIRSWMAPVRWIGQGVKAAALGHYDRMLYYFALIWSNGLMLYLTTVWMARKLLRRGYNRVATGSSLRRTFGGGWMDVLVSRTLFFLDKHTRLLLIKDLRTFRRDPAQWGQIGIFASLVVLYFSNMRRFYAQDFGRPFQNGISLLTLTATALLMCAYTGRFIFPMLSLEGRKFWILGLLPFKREKLLWGKFAFSALGCGMVAGFLVFFSDLMLDMPLRVVIVHLVTVIILSLSLSGLSVGLGACMPNFRESDPSKIAVGFSGTLNLIVGLMVLLPIIGLMAVPFHIMLAAEVNSPFSSMQPMQAWALFLLGASLGVGSFIIPLRAGAHSLSRREF